MKTRNKTVSSEAFIIAWQKAESSKEVAEILGMNIQAVRNRAINLKKKNVPLKKFSLPKPKPKNYNDLILLAQAYAPKDQNV